MQRSSVPTELAAAAAAVLVRSHSLLAVPVCSPFELSADCATYELVAAPGMLDNRSELHWPAVFDSTKVFVTKRGDIPSLPDQQVAELTLDAEQRLPLVGEGVESHSRWGLESSYVVALSADLGPGKY